MDDVQSLTSKTVDKKLPLYTVSGTNKQIGVELGKELKGRIIDTVEFYKTVFNRSQEEIFHYAKIFKSSIKSFSSDYASEIESMAKTVGIDPLWLYALNARSEIMNKFVNECTASFFPGTNLLGQNWDWAEELEELTVLTKILQPDKPDILQIAEPGIIGKIGLNSEGLGVCLNFLHIDGYDPSGVPTHVLLRGILDCSTIEEARELVTKHPVGRTSNIIVADHQGNFFDVEFAGDEQFIFDNTTGPYVHTNHYLGKNLNPDREEHASSYARFERANEIIVNKKKNYDLNDFKRLLTDKENKTLPICRKYVKPIKSQLKSTGTICSLIMDLPKREMHITRGNPHQHEFEKITF